MKVHAVTSTGLEPQNPRAGSLRESWEKNTGVVEKQSDGLHSKHLVCCHCKVRDSISLRSENKTRQIRISHNEKGSKKSHEEQDFSHLTLNS